MSRSARLFRALVAPLRTREGRAALLVFGLVFLAYVAQFRRALPMHPKPGADGFFSWMYATSLAFDGDIELTNDYRACGRPELLVDEGGGRPANPFYFGPALVWTPILFVVRHLHEIPASAPEAVRHACSGPLVKMVGSTAPVFTTLTLWLAYRVARRFAKPPFALAGVLVGAFGTTLVTYGGPMWFYSHLWSALGASVALFTFVRASERPELGVRWFLFGLAVALAALMRPQEGVWIVLGATWLAARAWTTLRAPTRGFRDLPPLLRPALLWTLGFASLFWVQLLVYRKIYGVFWLVPQGKIWLQLGHAHPFLMLFGAYSGWFTWTPLVWLGVLGAARLAVVRETRSFGVGLLAAGALDVYVSSAALAWPGSGTFGQRMLTSLAPAVVIGAAAILEALVERVRRDDGVARFALASLAVVPFLFVNWGMPWVWNPATTPQAYGQAVSHNFDHLHAWVGNPFSFPAPQVFRLRYGLPARDFDTLTAGEFLLVKDFRTAKTVSGERVDFASPPRALLLGDGLVKEAGGARLAKGRGRMVFLVYWPWVTHLKLAVRVPDAAAADVHLVANGFVTSRDLGRKRYAGPREELTWELPPWALDSGVNELVIESDADVLLESLELADQTVHDTSLR